MAETITWLHLSDLHSNPTKTGWDANEITSSLCEDLKYIQSEHGLHPDLIFFTGDLVYGQVETEPKESITKQFNKAKEFLDNIRKSFDPEIKHQDVYIVPGNHEVNIKEIDDSQSVWLRDKNRKIDHIIDMMQEKNKQWQRIMERLTDYRNFLKNAGYKHLLKEHQGLLIYADSKDVAGLKVGIAGLNSAWSFCKKMEKGDLWLGGKYQIGELKKQFTHVDISIALIHHPINWFVDQEDPNFQRLLERNFHFILHGHEHQNWVKCDATYGNTVISAGACYNRSDKENGYSIVRLNRRNNKGEVFLRQYDELGGGWVPRNLKGKTKDGCWTLDHLKWFKQFKTNGSKKKKTVEDTSPKKTTNTTKKKIVINGKSPFYTGGTIPLLSKSYIERESDRELPSLIFKHNFIFIQGMYQFGKSSLLLQHPNWLPSDWRIVFPSLEMCNGENREQFVKDFFDELSETLNVNIFNWRTIRSLLEVQKVAFLIDEIGSCENHVAKMLIERLYALYETSPNNVRIVLTFIDPISDYLKSIGIRNPKYHDKWNTIILNPFKKEEATRLLRFFPTEIERILKRNFHLIKQATTLEPNRLQRLLDKVWKKINEKDVNPNMIERFIEQIIKDFAENEK